MSLCITALRALPCAPSPVIVLASGFCRTVKSPLMHIYGGAMVATAMLMSNLQA